MKGLFSVLAIFVFTLVQIAQAAPDWEKALKDVCSFDQYCERLKTSDGAWVKPRKELLAVIKSPDMNAEIHRVAKLYNIDPVMIAGAIIAENTMNVSMKDTAQTWLAANMGITGVGKKKFSYGFGQINDEAAIEAEAHVAKIEGRKPKSIAEIREEILDPTKCVRLVGAIVRQVQDDYKAQGFDISKDVGVSTTLYNLGRSKEKAAQAKRNGATPKSNYFGFFVSKYLSEMKAAVGSPVVTQTVALATVKQDGGVAPAEVQSPVPGLAVVPLKEKSADAANAKQKRPAAIAPTEQVDTITKTLPLVSSPPLCKTTDDERGRWGSEHGGDTGAYGAPVGVIERNQSFRIISRALDCETTTWRLIETESGQTGWIKESVLESHQAKTVRPLLANSCKADAKGAASCVTALQTKLGEKSIGTERNLVFVSPIGPKMQADGEKSVSFDSEDFQCRDRTKEYEDRNRYNNFPSNPPPTPRPVPPQLSLADVVKENRDRASATKAQAVARATQNQDGTQDSTPPLATADEMLTGSSVYKANIQFYDKEMSRIASKLGLQVADLDTIANPYQGLTQVLARSRRQNSECLSIANSENPRECGLFPVPTEVREVMKKIDFDSAPDVAEAMTAQSLLRDAVYRGTDRIQLAMSNAQGYRSAIDSEMPFANYVPEDAEIASRTPDEIRKAMASCHAQVGEMKAQMQRDADEAQTLFLACQNDQTKCDDWKNSKWGKKNLRGGMYTGGTYYRSSQTVYQTRTGANVGGFGPYNEDPEPFFKAAQSATDEQLKTHSADFVSFARFCHARLNLFKDKNPRGNSLDCAMAPEFMNISNGQFARAVVAKTYRNDPGSFVGELMSNIPFFIKPGVVKEILGDEFAPKPTPTPTPMPPQPQQVSRVYRDEPKGPPNYCPNRTVEYIEELLKENDCIKHVYVPTRFLSGKLSPTDQRVIYRKFDTNDRFAIEVGSERCAIPVKK